MPTALLLFILFLCLCCSAFFSASETAMMSLNRYRLKHRVDEGDVAAKRADKLLKSPDRLLGTILLGNNFVNILATSLGTILGLRLFGDYGVLVATIVLTVVILIFAEIAPKTLAALLPDRIAIPAARVLTFLVALLYPLVWVLNKFIALLFQPFGIHKDEQARDLLTNEELKTIVMTSVPPSASRDSQDMLLNVLELEDATVDEVMVPRQEIDGIDLNDDWQEISAQIHQTRHSRLVVYRDHLDQVEGILHLRDVIGLYRENRFNVAAIMEIMRPCVFIPEHTLLRQQLLHFRQQKQRAGLVVDEYGDIQGLVTLEDILSHIVGDISETEEESPEILSLGENRYDVHGGISLRVLNRELGLRLPLDGPNTLSGLIIETLGNFPKEDTEVALDGCTVRVKAFAHGVVEQAEIVILPPEEER